jgi:hypothetical protein
MAMARRRQHRKTTTMAQRRRQHRKATTMTMAMATTAVTSQGDDDDDGDGNNGDSIARRRRWRCAMALAQLAFLRGEKQTRQRKRGGQVEMLPAMIVVSRTSFIQAVPTPSAIATDLDLRWCSPRLPARDVASASSSSSSPLPLLPLNASARPRALSLMLCVPAQADSRLLSRRYPKHRRFPSS